ncbi:MAG: folate family ECF transporter S component [Oscillospiraceae bacterium]
MSIKSYWQSASKEIKNVKSLTGTAMLSALNPVLDMMTITINQFLYISFSSLALAVCGFLYGPVLSGISAVFVDVLKYMVHPKGPFFIGFTFNEFLIGLIFGLFFYKKKITLKRVIVAKATLVLVINFFFTPLWLSIMYGQAFKIMVAARLIKNAILFPVDVAVLYGLLKFTETNIKKIRKDS